MEAVNLAERQNLELELGRRRAILGLEAGLAEVRLVAVACRLAQLETVVSDMRLTPNKFD